MGALFLAPVYLLLNGYILWRLIRWMAACWGVTRKRWIRIPVYLFYGLISTAPLTGFLAPHSDLRFILGAVGQYFLGPMAYILLVIGGLDIICFLLRRSRWYRSRHFHERKWFAGIGAFAILLIAGISGYGIYHAGDIRVRNEEITIAKDFPERELNIVLLADFHLGYNVGLRQVERVVELVNAEPADLICIAGDIFDNDYAAIRQPEEIADALAKMKSRYGTYACFGNHDVKEPILAGFTFPSKEKQTEDTRFLEFFERAGIRLLQDEGVMIDNAFSLFGRKDPFKMRKMGETRKPPAELLEGADHEKPVLVMDHQPKQLDELADAGVDLDLSGHTHNGQLFPVNLFLGMYWKNPYGILQRGGMFSCVTSGVGVWGPAMRVGTDSEIMRITVHFQ